MTQLTYVVTDATGEFGFKISDAAPECGGLVSIGSATRMTLAQAEGTLTRHGKRLARKGFQLQIRTCPT